MAGIQITFTADGTGHCLYTDEIDLRTIGAISIRRATEIEFNAGTQQWEVRLPGSPRVLFSAPSRVACLAWEQESIHPAC